MTPDFRDPLTLREIFGLKPFLPAVRDGLKALRGDDRVPATRWDLSSLRVLKPWISLPTWLGWTGRDGRTPVYNFYNRNLPPPEAPFSVRVKNVRDFRGGEWTYESHMGTDFAVPVGTPVTACAPGRVMDVVHRLDHGGLKLYVDHGSGLVTTYGHLSRVDVEPGDRVGRGQTVALSGAAGVELILFFPWVSPHVHLNVLLDGEPVDPFARFDQGETPLWRRGNRPRPHTGEAPGRAEPTDWNPHRLRTAVDACTDPEVRTMLSGIEEVEKLAVELMEHRLFYGNLFDGFPTLYEEQHPRRSVLDLPFRAEDYRGVRFPGMNR